MHPLLITIHLTEWHMADTDKEGKMLLNQVEYLLVIESYNQIYRSREYHLIIRDTVIDP